MKIKTTQVTVIAVADFNKLVTEVYGIPYNFQQQDGCKDRGMEEITFPLDIYDYKNTTIEVKVNGPEVGVAFDTWINHDKEDFEELNDFGLELFYLRNYYPHVTMVVQDLVKKGYIKEETFSIDIDW